MHGRGCPHYLAVLFLPSTRRYYPLLNSTRGRAVCNAWNHSSGCTCGWDGEGHLGRRGAGLGTTYAPSVARAWARYPSYINPNTTCPVCGTSSVYFYQSPDGGRVFFDKPPGPPWPKHPCADNTPGRFSRTTASAPAVTFRHKRARVFRHIGASPTARLKRASRLFD